MNTVRATVSVELLVILISSLLFVSFFCGNLSFKLGRIMEGEYLLSIAFLISILIYLVLYKISRKKFVDASGKIIVFVGLFVLVMCLLQVINNSGQKGSNEKFISVVSQKYKALSLPNYYVLLSDSPSHFGKAAWFYSPKVLITYNDYKLVRAGETKMKLVIKEGRLGMHFISRYELINGESVRE